MSNVVEFAEAAAAVKRKRLKERVSLLYDAGLTASDLVILSWACIVAFSEESRSIRKAMSAPPEEMLRVLKYLSVDLIDDDVGKSFVIGHRTQPVLVYTIADSDMSFDWHEEDAEGISLLSLENPGQFVYDFILQKLMSMDIGAYNVYGVFAHYVFFFSCQSAFNPLHLQYFSKTGRVGMIMHDPVRGVDVAVVTDLNQWYCSAEDWTKEIQLEETK